MFFFLFIVTLLFQIGDQILEVNGRSFLDVTHDEAVSQLKIHKRMTLTVRDVGKVPHSCTDHTAMPHANKMWESQGWVSLSFLIEFKFAEISLSILPQGNAY